MFLHRRKLLYRALVITRYEKRSFVVASFFFSTVYVLLTDLVPPFLASMNTRWFVRNFPLLSQTSFGLFSPPDIVNFRLKSLFVITLVLSKQIYFAHLTQQEKRTHIRFCFGRNGTFKFQMSSDQLQVTPPTGPRGEGGGGRGGLQPPQLQKCLRFFGQNADDSGKSTWEKTLWKAVKARTLKDYLLRRLPCQDGVKGKWSNDPGNLFWKGHVSFTCVS